MFGSSISLSLLMISCDHPTPPPSPHLPLLQQPARLWVWCLGAWEDFKNWEAEIMTRLGCVPAKSTHTRDMVSSARLMTITFQLILRKDARLLWVDLLDLPPRARKWSVSVLLRGLISRGHKIVRAIATPINKTLCVRKRKKIWKH